MSLVFPPPAPGTAHQPPAPYSAPALELKIIDISREVRKYQGREREASEGEQHDSWKMWEKPYKEFIFSNNKYQMILEETNFE